MPSWGEGIIDNLKELWYPSPVAKEALHADEDTEGEAPIILVLVGDSHVCGGSCPLAGGSIGDSRSLKLPG